MGMTNQDYVLQEDWLHTARLRVRVVTEAPVDGLEWYEGHSDPFLVVNFRAQLQTFEVAADGASSYRGLVAPGDFSFLPPNSTFGGHYVGSQMCYACISFPTEVLNPRFADGLPVIMRHDPLIRAFAEALYAQRHRSDPDVLLYRESLTESLVHHLQLIHLDPLNFDEDPRFQLERLSSYIRANVDQKLTVAELATLAGTTSQTLQKLVRKQFGQSVYNWVTSLRLERSLELLRHSQLNLATIATECGFAHQSHWTRLFHKKFGVTPARIRQG